MRFLEWLIWFELELKPNYFYLMVTVLGLEVAAIIPLFRRKIEAYKTFNGFQFNWLCFVIQWREP